MYGKSGSEVLSDFICPIVRGSTFQRVVLVNIPFLPTRMPGGASKIEGGDYPSFYLGDVDMDLKKFNEIILIVVESLIFLLFYISLVSKRDFIQSNKLKSIIFSVFYVTLAYWISSYLPIGYYTIAIMLATILLLSFITRTNVYNAAIIVVITTLFIVIIDTIISVIFVAALRMELKELMNSPSYYSIFAWCSKIVQVTLAVLFYRMNHEKLKINLLKSNNSQYMFAALQLLLMALFIGSINYSVGEIKDKAVYNIMLVFMYVLSLVLAIYDIREREQMLKVLHKEKSLEEYIKNLEDVINVIRREKHDFLNHIQTVYAICKLKKPNALDNISNYLKRLTTDLNSSYRFYETGNDYIDGLLAIKSHTCFENSIDFSVKIGAHFTMADTDESDVAGVVGNIINNSIECLQALPENQNKKIEFVTYMENDMFYLMISNNGPEIPKQNVNLIFERGFTSKSDTSEHGFGLFIARQMVMKNNGSIYVTSECDWTEFVIRFNVRENINEGNNQCVIG